MKSKFPCLLLLLGAPLLHAQSTPSLMSYQGRVTDAAGVLAGNTSPVNRKVDFRLYTASSGGTALYAETQTVTISGGEFGVLIGNGAGIIGSPGPGSPATTPYKTLSDIINSGTYGSLYLGVTVDDGTAAVDPEIAPRQQMVSGAFALRAKVAETVAGGAVTTAMMADGQVSTVKIASGAVDSSRILDFSIAAADIANSTINAGKLDTTTIGLWTPQGSSVYRGSGNVGIGEANPGFPLNFGLSWGDKISLFANSGNHYGFGIQGGLLQIHSDYATSDIAFGYGNSASFTETMRVKGNGNVGIGTSNPGAPLHVSAGSNFSPDGNGLYVYNSSNSAYQHAISSVRVAGASGGNPFFSMDVAGVNGWSMGLDNGDSQKFKIANSWSQLATNTKFTINTGGYVGIGTSSPAASLHVAGGILARGGAPGGSGVNNNGYAFSGNGGDNNSGMFSSADGQVEFYSNAVERMRITPSGVSVVTTDQSEGAFSVGGGLVSVGSRGGSPGYCRVRYDGVDGRFFFEGYNTSINNGSWRGFSIDGNSDLDWFSDRRLKKDIVDAEPMLGRLMQLPFRRFKWKASTNPNEAPEFGVIAQEVEPLFPDIVGKGSDGILTVGYTTFATIACKAIQELKVEKDDQLADVQQQLDGKDQRIADLEARLSALEKLIQSTR